MFFSVAAVNGDAGGHVVTSSHAAKPEVWGRGVVTSPMTSPTRPILTVTNSGMRSPVSADDPLWTAYRTPSPLIGLNFDLLSFHSSQA